MEISVIIPTYRPAAYLWQCIDSLCAQTLPSDRFEVVLVLNGCKDPYKENIGKYLTGKNIHANLLQTDVPGVSHARNMGLDHARGKYVVFIDDDDWIAPNYLESLLEKAAAGRIVVANVRSYIEDKDCYSSSHFLSQAYARYKRMGEKKDMMSVRSFLSSACCKLIPREMIGQMRFDTRIPLGEDAFFMASISKNMEDLVPAPEDACYYFRIRKNSSSHKERPYLERAGIVFRLCQSYARLYLSDMRHYDFLFMTSRIAATLRRLFQRSWE